jgi:hypothetical protein
MRNFIRKQSRKSQKSRRGGAKLKNYYKVTYEVTCNPNITCSDLFSMANTGLYEMATGHGDVPIISVNDMTVSQNSNNIQNEYIIQFIVEFSEIDYIVEDFQESYLNGIKDQPLFKNGSFVPNESLFDIVEL